MKRKIYAFALAAAFIASMPFSSAFTAAAAGEFDDEDVAAASEWPAVDANIDFLQYYAPETAQSPVAATPDIDEETAHREMLSEIPNGIEVYINEKYCCFDVPARLIESTTYVPIRACAEAMGDYEVLWEDGKAKITGDRLSVEIVPNSNYITANGRYIYAPTGIRLVEDTTMIPIRVLADAFCAEVLWDGDVHITTTDDVIENGDTFYNEDDVYWLSRIINAEARGECLEGKIAVGNVVMNRVASDTCPDTIYDVIFDFEHGIQFTPAYTGTIYNTPTEESIIAAKLVLDGADVAGDAMYFASIKNCWAAYARPFLMSIGNHDFYA